MQTISNKALLIKSGTEVVVLGKTETGMLVLVPVIVQQDMYVATDGKPYAVKGRRPDWIAALIGIVIGLILATFLNSASAASSINTGTGQLKAAAAINIKVVIPAVIGLNESRVVANERQTVAKSVSYEDIDQREFAEDSHPLSKKVGWNNTPRTPSSMVYTVSLP